MTAKGKTVLAKLKKASEFELALVETMMLNDKGADPESIPDPPPPYIMVVNNDGWLDLGEIMVDRVGKVDQCEALVFHELCHARVEINKEGIASYKMRDHDFTGFFTEVARYGAWLPHYQMTEAAFKGEVPPEDDE